MGFTPRVDTPCPQARTAGTAIRPIHARLVNPLFISSSILAPASLLPPTILMAMHPPLLRPLAFLFAVSCFAATPQLSRPVRAWEEVRRLGATPQSSLDRTGS